MFLRNLELNKKYRGVCDDSCQKEKEELDTKISSVQGHNSTDYKSRAK